LHFATFATFANSQKKHTQALLRKLQRNQEHSWLRYSRAEPGGEEEERARGVGMREEERRGAATQGPEIEGGGEGLGERSGGGEGKGAKNPTPSLSLLSRAPGPSYRPTSG
jgi:hypothetical protein